MSINFYEEDTVERNSSDIHNRSIIFIGLSGSGKSSMIKYLMNKEETEIQSGISFSNVTENFCVCNPFKFSLQKEITARDKEYLYKIKPDKEFMIQCYDTIGIGDPINNVNDIIESIRCGIIKRITRINQVFIVIKLDRLRMGFSDSLIELLKNFKEWGCTKDNFTLIITFTDFMKKEKKINFAKEAVKTLNLEEELREIICVSLPDLEEIDKKWHPVFEEIRKEGYNSLIKSILFGEKSVNPRNYIMDQIQEEIDKNKERLKILENKHKEICDEIDLTKSKNIPIFSDIKNWLDKDLKKKEEELIEIKKERVLLQTSNKKKQEELKIKVDNGDVKIILEEKQTCVERKKID